MTGIRESSGSEPTFAPVAAVADPNAVRVEPTAAARAERPPLAARAWKRRPRALTVMAVLGVLLFALWGIGGPLFGTSTLTPTDEMVSNGPWVSAGFAGTVPSNTYLDDTYTSELPSEILFKQQLDHGKVAQWNPYGAGGSALGAIPDYAFYSPLSVPFYVLPSWLAPAYERLLEIVCSVGGAFLFLRRVSLSRPAALLGGITFAGSGFMVAWLGFPQTRVAAFIPVLFWTIERFIQERRARDAALAALPVAALFLGGFPSVAGYALLTGTAYAVVRLAGEHREELRRRVFRPLVRPVLYLAGSLAAGIGLALFQLIPFLSFFGTWMIQGRSQSASATLPVPSVLTMVAPWSFGTVDAKDPIQFVLSTNMVEAVSYIGAAAAVLVVAAIAMPRRGRALLPVGTWVFVIGATLAWIELIYLGGPPLALLQRLPGARALFEQNFIGRARSILGFLLAVLVAVGFELLVRARAQEEQTWPRRRWWAAVVVAGGVASAGVMVYRGRTTMRVDAAASGQDVTKALHQYGSQIGSAAVIVAIAVACVVALRVAGRQAFIGRKQVRIVRFSAATTLIVLMAVQGAQFMQGYYPKSSKAMFYPVTDTHTFLADNLGEQRYASSYDAIVFGTGTAYDLRSVNGHNFLNADFAALMQGVPDGAVPYPTYVDFQPHDTKQATSPVLDRLGTKYWVAGPTDGVFGAVSAAARSGTTQLVPGQPVTVPVTGPLRGVSVTPEGNVPWDVAGLTKGTTIDVVIHDASGKVVATSSQLTGARAGTPLQVAVAADSVPAGTALTATITLHASAPLTVDADNGKPAVDTIDDTDDGLRVAYVGSSVIYERLNAMPRIRWASQSTVVASQDQRVAMLASGTVPDDTVVLSDPGPAASGQPAAVRVLSDGTDSISSTVNAQGSGYLVVADADQVGWQVTVDGKNAALVKADQGLVAVNVPAGTHTVTLHYGLPQQTAATWASGAVGVALLAVPAGEWWWERRRSRIGKGPVPWHS
ncbi:YfhO family protein [Catenulispora sp. NL8]|uniref:YfhO family protein n=1 Tax=Catenulispora pinistramenti TaxID=2705254 RepID=A0ABS5L038_9ACTN|nr:YfhO family protein [Catenulispora pinistramenti]MBS2551688.1 YfhO family protein [Catenulispora pinistramenti]